MRADDQFLIAAEQFPGGDERSRGPLDTAGSTCTANGHCVTCADEALPARVLHVDEALGLALVEVNGVTVEVDVTLVDQVRPGQLLLVHGGVAMASLGEA
ncbi:MAG: HypC/HybG/HupF family hydrogenase formation chaperone [Chloroflexota bacterium]|nr:HypC/HybG/HupF family hydrogenase formation chaperone [Chloroflexota bacterium]